MADCFVIYRFFFPPSNPVNASRERAPDQLATRSGSKLLAHPTRPRPAREGLDEAIANGACLSCSEAGR